VAPARAIVDAGEEAIDSRDEYTTTISVLPMTVLGRESAVLALDVLPPTDDIFAIDG
jgi:hypothetical protein